MELKLGVITRNITFVYYIEDQLQCFDNLEVLPFRKNSEYNILLFDYDNSEDIYDSIINSGLYNKSTIIIISDKLLLKYKQSNKFVTPIIINLNDISTKLVNTLNYITFTDTLIIKSQRIHYKLRYYDILLIYPENHYLNFVLETETFKSRMSINDISELLIAHDFAISSASTYVNIHRIKSISKHEVCFDCGIHTNVSRYKYKTLVNKFKEEV